MNYDEIISALSNPDMLGDNGFSIVASIAQHHARDPESPEVQELVLRGFENLEDLNGGTEVLVGLARDLGLFPYLPEEQLSTSDQIAFEFHKPEGLSEQGIVFHRPQAMIYSKLMNVKSIILSAPTSFGKSLIIDAVVISQKYKNILIVVPTIALMDETRRRLVDLGAAYKIITHSNQKPDEFNLFVMTQERAMGLTALDDVDFFVIDEFYKLAPTSLQDTRADILNNLFYKLATANKPFYMLGPSIQSIPPEVSKRFECEFVYETYQTVVSNVHRLSDEGDEIEKTLEVLERTEGASIIYCRSPHRASEIASNLAEKRHIKISADLRPAIEWLSENYHKEWHLVTALQAGIGVHHGRIPRSIAQYVLRAFDQDLIDVLVCTSSLIEGVNTKAKNVLILDDTISRQKFDYFTFNNIRGRSGRMFQHFVGDVYLFHDPPAEMLPFIDIPSITQSENASEALLLQLNPEDLEPTSRVKVERFFDQEILSVATIRKNQGIDPDNQVSVASEIEEKLPYYHPLLSWRERPSYDQLQATCLLIWDYFDGRRLGAGSVLSAKQLTYQIRGLERRPIIRDMIVNKLDFIRRRNPDAPADVAVQNVLDFLKLWPRFHFPRLLKALHNIQDEIFSKHGLPLGDYIAYIAEIENLFMHPALLSLEEFGLPIQIGRKLEERIGQDGDLDDALRLLAAINVESLDLDQFEKSLLIDTVKSI